MNVAEFTDVSYEVDNGLAWITISRPERYNAFRGRTIDELIWSFKMAWADKNVGVIALNGRKRGTTALRKAGSSRWNRSTELFATSPSR